MTNQKMAKRVTLFLSAVVCGVLLAACNTPNLPVGESESSSSVWEGNESSSENSTPPTKLPGLPPEYNSLLEPYQSDFAAGVSVGGRDFVLDAENHRFAFTLLLRTVDGSAEVPVDGTFISTEYEAYYAGSWGGISVLDGGDTLAVYSKGTLEFLAADTLKSDGRSPLLFAYQNCWVLGIGHIEGGYVAILGGPEEGHMLYLDAKGAIVRSVPLPNPEVIQLRDSSYFNGQSYYRGLAFMHFPTPKMISFGSSFDDMLLLKKQMHSGWVAHGDTPGGELFNLTMLTPEGEMIVARENLFHRDGDLLYTLMNYTYPASGSEFGGYMAMRYKDGVLQSAFAFEGPPNAYSFDYAADWTIDGDTVEVWMESGSQYYRLDFKNNRGYTEYRHTAEMAERGDTLATSPDGRYKLKTANMNGAGDGYWGQMLLVDGRSGSIGFVCNLPVRYAADSAATNFADNSCYTTASGNLLRIYTVDTPEKYRQVTLTLPGERDNVLYCNALYDLPNNRYLLAYLDDVELDGGGWHGYDNAVYHVAVFDADLRLVGDVAVPNLPITHSLYGMPCPTMELSGNTLLLETVPVVIPK